MGFAMVVVGAVVLAAHAVAPDLAQARRLHASTDAALQRHDAVWASISLRREIVLLPRTPAYDAWRHQLMLQLGAAMLASTSQTHDRGFVDDARRMLRRYRIVHEELFGSTPAAVEQRAEIDAMLARIERERGRYADDGARGEWLPEWAASLTVAQIGIASTVGTTHSLYAWAGKRRRARAAFMAMRPALRRCYARAVMRMPIRYITTTLELTIDDRGRVASARVLGDPLVDADGNLCIEESARTVRIANASADPPLRVVVPVMFRWGGIEPGRWLGLNAR